MINHITIYVSNLSKSKKFYENALKPLGYKVIEVDSEREESWVGLAVRDVQGQRDLWIKKHNNKLASGPLSCLAFTAYNEQMVKEFYENGLAYGGKDNGAPGYRPKYWKGYYAAFVLDPDGNNIEAVYDDITKSTKLP